MEIINAGTYNIYLENKNFEQLARFLLLGQYKNIFVLADDNTIRYCMPRIEPLLKRYNYSVILLHNGEMYKSLQSCEYIWTQLLKKGANRNDLLLNLGGGVITDIGGFAASVYKRGMDFVHLPTTLLSQMDASVGGKTGIDWNGIKNMIGNFANPKAVFIFSGFLYTLPERELFSGWAEGLKHGLLQSESLWEEMQQLYFLYENKQLEGLNALLSAGIGVKKEIVAQDWEDKHIRQSLNLGHTIGHALEAWALGQECELKHGEAVILGLIAELNLSIKLLNADKEKIYTILNALKAIYQQQPFWSQWAGVKIPVEQILPYLYADKKNENQRLRLPLWVDFGQTVIGQTVEIADIRWALWRLEIELG